MSNNNIGTDATSLALRSNIELLCLSQYYSNSSHKLKSQLWVKSQGRNVARAMSTKKLQSTLSSSFLFHPFKLICCKIPTRTLHAHGCSWALDSPQKHAKHNDVVCNIVLGATYCWLSRITGNWHEIEQTILDGFKSFGSNRC